MSSDAGQSAADPETALESPADPGLIPLLKVLRKPGDEVQLTTSIAAIASSDPRLAAGLLRAVLEEAPRQASAKRLLRVLPTELRCEAERPLPKMIDGWRGRIDLEFTGKDGFHVLVEAKIYALYAPGQLQGYLDTSDCQGLVGLVRNRTFEETEPEDERWAGSVRWADVLEKWMALEHADPVVMELPRFRRRLSPGVVRLLFKGVEHVEIYQAVPGSVQA